MKMGLLFLVICSITMGVVVSAAEAKITCKCKLEGLENGKPEYKDTYSCSATDDCMGTSCQKLRFFDFNDVLETIEAYSCSDSSPEEVCAEMKDDQRKAMLANLGLAEEDIAKFQGEICNFGESEPEEGALSKLSDVFDLLKELIKSGTAGVSANVASSVMVLGFVGVMVNW